MNPASLDESLVAAARAGSSSAFARLVARHQQALRAFLRRTCGNAAQADDLAQEVFVAAWKNLGSLQSGASVRAWLCGIGYRKHLSAFRRTVRETARGEAWETARREIGEAPRHEERLALQAAMAELPDDQRACVALCLAADFSHAEAAEALNLPIGTVKSHVARGRARLLQRLGVSDGSAG